MTITEAIAEVRANIKRQSQAYADSRIIQALNWAMRNIESLADFPEMQSTRTLTLIPGVAFADFSSVSEPIKNVMSVHMNFGGSDTRALEQLPRWEFYRSYPEVFLDPTSFQGRPFVYMLQDAGQIFFFLVPDTAYTTVVRVNDYSIDFTAQSAENYMLRKYSQMLVASATSYAFLNLRELEDANFWQNQVFAPLFRIAVGGTMDTRDWIPKGRGFRSGFSALDRSRSFDPLNPFFGVGGRYGPY